MSIDKSQGEKTTNATHPNPLALTLRYDVRTEQQRTTDKKKRFIESMDEAMGVVSRACELVGIYRSTYYIWLENDPEFRKQINRVQKEQLGRVEDKLFAAIEREEPWAIALYLSRVHAKYRPKQDNYVIPTERTLEDLLDNYQDNEGIAGQQNTNPIALENQGQAGQDSAVPLQLGAGVLLGAQDTQEFNLESPTERC